MGALQMSNVILLNSPLADQARVTKGLPDVVAIMEEKV